MSAYKNILPCFKYFYGIAWRHEKPYFLVVAANMLVTGLAPFINIFIPKRIIDELLGARDIGMLAMLVALLVMLNLAVSLANNLIRYFLGIFHLRLEQRFTRILAEKCMSMDFGNTENAEVLAQREKAVRGMDTTYGSLEVMTFTLNALVSSVITLIGTLYVVGRLSPMLLGALVAVTAANMWIVSRLSKGSTQFYKDLIEASRLFSYYSWWLKDFRYGKDIRLYNAVPLIKQRTENYVSKDWYLQRKFNRRQNRYTILATLLNAAQQALLYGYLGVRVVTKLITIGEFQMLVTAALGFASSLRGIVENVIGLARVVEYMDEYRVFLLLPDTARTGVRPVPETPEHTFEFRDVSFKYPKAEQYALHNVSITIRPGSKLSVVGQNGAGKTTFIKLLCRLYDPTEGEILLDGVNIGEYDLDSYRKLLSVVFQDYRLLSFSLRENIACDDRSAEDDRVADAIEKAGVDERVGKLEKGLDTAVYKDFDKDGVEFSGGESQKIAIARAVYKNAPVTVLDEPTAALDPMAEYDVYKRFDSLIGSKTAVYISHRLSSCRFCDSIAVFKDGTIVQRGPHDELVTDEGGEYHKMWSAQAKYYE
jgi:ATP-binding cassette subfamily B protein/ATP-binding cassette subfamily C protein